MGAKTCSGCSFSEALILCRHQHCFYFERSLFYKMSIRRYLIILLVNICFNKFKFDLARIRKI